ncbi:helix-turn-helix transcriptional regulator [Kineococcus terrestris]|uniref:helix-turn-helix transcriptional regulator n=1 Tax=Kineococcus terrestris TaxID=2044856 RepID=UPI0034DB3471
MSAPSSRLLSLLSLLQARRDQPGDALADRLGVSPRTVRRDVDRLRELGYPVRAVMGPAGGYRLEAGADLPPLLFDDEQAVALAVALQAAATGGSGVAEGAARALTTLRQVMPARLRGRLDAVRVDAVAAPGSGDVDPAVLVAVSAAVRAREVLRFDHERPGAPDGPAAAPRRVEPHAVVARAGRWYLLAWDLDRGDWRTFRLDRVRPRVPTGPRFAPREVPGGDAAAFVDARTRGGDGPGWPCTGRVLLDLPAARVAGLVADGAVEPVGEHRCRVVLGSWSWTGLVSRLAAFDADVVVEDPPALREALARTARRLAAAGGEEHLP